MGAQVDQVWLPKKQNGLNIVIHYPEFAELASFLSDEGKATFLDGIRSAVHHSLFPQPYWIELFEEGSASVAVGDLSKSTVQKLMEFAEGIHKDLRLWTGTFGKIGIPPMKFGMGALVGEFNVKPDAPKISGTALMNATDLAKNLCAQFDVSIAIESDLARFASHAPEWVDIEDLELPGPAEGQRVSKRIFTKLTEREEPEDIQLLKSARKAFFQKDFVDAKEKFDRLSRLRQFKHLSKIYLRRIAALKKS